VDHIIFVSSTGVATPTIDAHLFNKHELSPHVRRTPIWGLGCLGGAVGLSRAMEYTIAFPDSIVLVVALEICSLAFQIDDLTPKGIIASALFSDGASAALVVGRESRLYALPGLELLDSHSTTYPDSLHVMGWEVVDEGFKVILSREIPQIVKANMKNGVVALLSRRGLSISHIRYFPTHPGGARVIAAYKEALALKPDALSQSEEVLRHHGNMSSPTVHFVLRRLLHEEKNPGTYGIISALGPGFSSELLLFRTA
jgi:alkylresorcinol/alkylpyrone synthase